MNKQDIKAKIGHFVNGTHMIDVTSLWSGGVVIKDTDFYGNEHAIELSWETVQNLHLVLEKHITEVKDADYASDAYTS